MNDLDLTAIALVLVAAFAVPAAVWFGVGIGRERMADELEELWLRNGGWIPGAAISQLEGVIGRPLPEAHQLAERRFGPSAACSSPTGVRHHELMEQYSRGGIIDAEIVEEDK